MSYDFSRFVGEDAKLNLARDRFGRFAPLCWNEQKTGSKATPTHGEYSVHAVGAKHGVTYKSNFAGVTDHLGHFDTTAAAKSRAEKHHADKYV